GGAKRLPGRGGRCTGARPPALSVREARSSFFAHGQRGYDSVPIYAISVPFCHGGEVAKHSPAAMQRLAGQRFTHRKVFCQLLSYRGKTVALGAGTVFCVRCEAKQAVGLGSRRHTSRRFTSPARLRRKS